MKDKKFRHIYTDKIISAYEYGRIAYLELWNESKRLGNIPEESADYDEPKIDGKTDELIEYGIEVLSEDHDYEEII